ncbi:DUF2922 domain-containing protein [Anaerosinus gibii]|uniref:DUF2922 domain-containing protein n=1 Tax=Selenobaculum gibii TaxID=3054208 RepID=A0A9Y2AFJ7_9FIRM|nr:DUF2922 domain-containing protein [Selenobaculum gbiensis]WIW70720.1 DUF2922 domain-containing protein [Selenobaculum gbiensis]
MAKTLEMVFKTEADKELSISLAEPRDNLTRSEVESVMNQLIAKNAIASTNGKLAAVADVKIRTTDKTSLL